MGTQKSETDQREVERLRAHVEYLSEVIDVLRWTLAYSCAKPRRKP